MWYVRSFLFIFVGVLISCNEVKMATSQKSAAVNLRSAQFTQTEFDEAASGISLKSQGATVTESSTQFNVFPNTIPYDSAAQGLTLKHWAFLDYLPSVYTNVGEPGFVYDDVSGILIKMNYNLVELIDTKKNSDPRDDVLYVRYTNTTTPAVSGFYRTAVYEASSGQLILGTNTGITIIDTNKTSDISDDSLLGSYTVGTGHLLNNNVFNVTFSPDGLMYIGSVGHIQVIDRQGTASLADDVRIFDYTSGGTPSVAGSYAVAMSFDSSTDQLFITTASTGATFTAIDTQGTADPSDDTLLYKYDGTTTPALNIAVGAPNHHYDSATGLLVISGRKIDETDAMILLIDTKKTPSNADDSILVTLDSSSFGLPFVMDMSTGYDHTNHRLYISHEIGFIVYEPGDLTTVLDDSLTVDQGLAAYPWNSAYEFAPVPGGLVYLGPAAGAAVYDPSQIQRKGEYHSKPIPTAHAKSKVTWNSTGSVSLMTRTGGGDAYYENDLSTSIAADWGDAYGWGTAPTTFTNTAGVITATGFPLNGDATAFWYDTGKPAGTYPAGSLVKVRLRANCTKHVQAWIYDDDWYSDFIKTLNDNSWAELTFRSMVAFSKIGFYFRVGDYNHGHLDANCTSVEIDNLSITAADASWSAWTAVSGSGGTIGSDFTVASYMQYKATLTSDGVTAPVLKSVSVKDGYFAAGSAIGEAEFAMPSRPLKLISSTVIPAGTSITFFYSLDGSSWTALGSGNELSFPAGLDKVSKVWIKAAFTTTDERVSPVIKSMRVSR